MFITLLLLICALALSTIAAWYSIIGLATIFAGAFYPVIIMGSILEASKLIVSSWLYQKWNEIPFLLKTYLTSAVIVLMCITSIGIFGFLSKAHIDQTVGTQENLAQINKINSDIAQNKFNLEKATNRLKQLETSGGGADGNIQNQINTEQQRIDSAYARIQPAIDEQNKIIENQTKLISSQLLQIDQELSILQKYIDSNDIIKAQQLVGTRADGNWGPGTATAVRNWQQQKMQEKSQIVNKLEDLNQNNLTIKKARDEIAKIRETAELQVNESNKLINRLRDQLGKSSVDSLSKDIQEQQNIIKATSTEIDKITEKKYQLESAYRKLEAEVGPIKYIANFIYDSNTDSAVLEKSVMWMIIIIIVVFDPLAVLMLIAANSDLKKKIQPVEKESNLIIESNTLSYVGSLNVNIDKSYEINESSLTDAVNLVQSDDIQPNVEIDKSINESNNQILETNIIISNSEINNTTIEPVPTSNSAIELSQVNADEVISKLKNHTKNKNQPIIQIKRDYRGYKY